MMKKLNKKILNDPVSKNQGLIKKEWESKTIEDEQDSLVTEDKNSNNGWHEIDWKRANMKVKDIQEKIVTATLDKDFKRIYNLQWKLLNTFEARALAIRKVVINKGGKTCGVDGVIWKGPKEFYKAIISLSEILSNINDYKAQPVLRVYIPKGNTGQMRPLGIPTMMDRAIQAIYHFCVDPVVETQSDPNSYGFRKGRSTQDAITAVRSLLDKKTHPRWILEADIAKCFDKIDHEFLMKNTPIVHKHVLKEWLNSGIMDDMKYIDTNEGTPQGGIFSPVLCNIALNGIEEKIKKANPKRKGISTGVHIIRYADDMIITGRTQEIAMKNKEILAEFLKERGLNLSETKTLVTHIRKGFDFLGFHIRRMQWNPRLNQETDQKTVLIIKPSKKGVKRLMEKIKKEVIDVNKPLEKIISELNPILRGWGEHKRISYHSQETFITIDNWIYWKMIKWASKKKTSLRKTLEKYVIATSTRAWNWAISKKMKLINMGEIPIIIKRPLKLDKNPYIQENLDYFEKRRQIEMDAKFRATVYKKYQHKCPLCEESLYNGESVELHHIIPQKSEGTYKIKNIAPLHELCHWQVTRGNRTLERLNKLKAVKEHPVKRNSKGSKVKKRSKSIG